MKDLPAKSPPPDPSSCPLCGHDNRCAMELERATGQPQGPCWCVSQRFPPELLSRLPDSARGQACVCARCLSGFEASGSAQP